MGALEAVALVPIEQSLLVHRIGLAAEGQRLEPQIDSMPIRKLADRAKHHRSVALPWLQRPQAVNLGQRIRTNNKLHPAPAFACGIEKGVSALARRRSDGFQFAQEICHAGLFTNALIKNVSRIDGSVRRRF